MKTIKLIDLLNKLANGEEVPLKIKYRNNEYTRNRNGITVANKYYYSTDGYVNLLEKIHTTDCLIEEVEIIEDVCTDKLAIDDNGYIHTELGAFKGRKMDIAFANKINEIMGKVNSLNGGV